MTSIHPDTHVYHEMRQLVEELTAEIKQLIAEETVDQHGNFLSGVELTEDADTALANKLNVFAEKYTAVSNKRKIK